jgi:pimeloyl-ACP methyl ester carboxylesterase
MKRRAYRIKAPSLIIWGGEDRINPTVYAEDFSKLIAGSKVQVLAKAGHLPMLEQPDAFSEAILGFLNG